MNYLKLGYGKKLGLALHGLGSNNSIFKDCLPEELFQEWTFICPNLPGHGENFIQLDSYNIESLLSYLDNQLDLKNFNAFIGHSLGALLGMLLHKNSNYFQELIILDYFPVAKYPKAFLRLAKNFEAYFERQLDHFFSFSHFENQALLSRLLSDAKQCDPQVFSHIFHSLYDLALNEHEPIILNIPTLVIHQVGQTVSLKDKINRAFLLSKQVNTKTVSSRGHFVMLTNIKEFQAILLEWLSSNHFLL